MCVNCSSLPYACIMLYEFNDVCFCVFPIELQPLPVCSDHPVEPPADPATAPIKPGVESTIEINKDKVGLGLSIVGGSDTLLVRITYIDGDKNTRIITLCATIIDAIVYDETKNDTI